jgi:hypothetical protein
LVAHWTERRRRNTGGNASRGCARRCRNSTGSSSIEGGEVDITFSLLSSNAAQEKETQTKDTWNNAQQAKESKKSLGGA